jgi:hypothetical protein
VSKAQFRFARGTAILDTGKTEIMAYKILNTGKILHALPIITRGLLRLQWQPFKTCIPAGDVTH